MPATAWPANLGPRVLTAIGAEVTPLYCEIDGTFPNHHPDPSEAHNLVDLINMVAHLDADLGIAFDGDGDRLAWSRATAEHLPRPLADAVRRRRAGAQSGRDDHLRREVHRASAGPHPAPRRQSADVEDRAFADQGEDARDRCRTGRRDERPLLLQGALVRLRRRHYAAARLLEILAAQPQDPDRNAQRACRMACRRRRSRSMRPTATRTASSNGSAMRPSSTAATVDHRRPARRLRRRLGLVRASNTTPVLVLRFDADSREALARIQADFRRQLLALKPDLALPF
jgi:phosphomannomutase/phosphoglucomutase